MALSRRQFLLGTLGAGAAGLAATQHPWDILGTGPASNAADGGPGAAGSGNTPPAGAARSGIKDGEGILVLVTLYGGNDGLNTLIPHGDSAYLAGRGALGYQPDQVIPLADGLGLHPDLKGLKALWDARQLAVVRGVGYPDPNRSHFRSMDIWQSAVPDHGEPTGWIGRWLDRTGVDPLRAIAVGPILPPALAGAQSTGAAVPLGPLGLPGGTNVAQGFAALARSYPEEAPLAALVAQRGADLLLTERTVAEALAHQPDGDPGATSLERAPNVAPAHNALASQLSLVSTLIKAGVPTRVYSVSLGGFDTHANEKDTHARLMAEWDSAVSGFLSGLGSEPNAKGVVVLTHSEFGRRVSANASGGTDHGTAAPVFVAGPAVKGGFYGEEPSLTDLDHGDLKFTTDFRSVYSTILERVLGVEPKVSLDGSFPAVAFV
ncbi:MAG: DUF1501 domain-containing protein [Acidimicrobiales bacterium]